MRRVMACRPPWRAPSSEAWGHAYAQFGDIKYRPDSRIFEWVNRMRRRRRAISIVPPPDHQLRQYNPFTRRHRRPVVDYSYSKRSLTTTMDEPTTAYGLLAEDVQVAPTSSR
jgi:microcin C transport system substrate-binding protein